MVLPDKFIDQDKPEQMYKIAGLDSFNIVDKVLETLNSKVIIKKKLINFCTVHCALKSDLTKHNSSLLHR